ncbi:hypothetical protein Pmani_016178 [Petrolisthes manimaculis]|uniref:Uncharacterized protein n=1 Tax=Petrolisthes manimaculis TaxID=1843537 RepID=A0AAE1PQ94_9EUCA|nr:hypothetical protein Pmani_016178 [Petrolisthes manimaculis]
MDGSVERRDSGREGGRAGGREGGREGQVMERALEAVMERGDSDGQSGGVVEILTESEAVMMIEYSDFSPCLRLPPDVGAMDDGVEK